MLLGELFEVVTLFNVLSVSDIGMLFVSLYIGIGGLNVSGFLLLVSVVVLGVLLLVSAVVSGVLLLVSVVVLFVGGGNIVFCLM